MKESPRSNGVSRASESTRREFLRDSSFAVLGMTGVPLVWGAGSDAVRTNAPVDSSENTTDYKGQSPPVKLGLIGCGSWGRELLKTASILPNAPVVAVCDIYPAALRRAAVLAPEAKQYQDYGELVADPGVEAVVVATPSHLHVDIVLAALKAGKHVYCEVPLATTVEDARLIAKAARDTFKVNFQAGLQNRADRQIIHLATFIRTGVLGKPLKARQQYHKKQSWRVPAPTPERQKEVNWRLDNTVSAGLIGELGIHQIDLVNWFFMLQPTIVTGFGSIRQWRDGRTVPDNVVAVLQYPTGLFLTYEATLGNSFDGDLSLFFGTDCAVMLRDRRAWMFQEIDAPQLGWEVNAIKEKFYKATGIVLAAGYSKALPNQATQPAEIPQDPKSPLQYALEAFVTNSYNHQVAVRDYAEAYDPSDVQGLKQYLQDLTRTRVPAAGWMEGYEATVTALKANEAVVNNKEVVISPELYQLG
ncbi:MAG: Gfo/Idh/MocA family oxidoreductase [Verrucomicrobiae bacterium]|nr:Gfo/Idh/MocA family oxidoreductase [Verrucomicrobiae bacterium]